MDNIKSKFEKVLESLAKDLRILRVGRASASLVEDISIEVYENQTPLNQMASIAVPQHNQILITPWDPQNLAAISDAINKSDLQINPVLEGNAIRLTLPPLTQETRRDLVKEVVKHTEEARVSVRNIREEIFKGLSDLSEDERFRQEKEIQKLVDEYNGKIKEMHDNKAGEILEN